MSLFIQYPFLAAAIGVLFLVGYRVSRRPALGVAAAAWLVYSAYEFGMRLRWLCSGECNIRIDLLVIYPVLIGLSVFALVVLVRGRITQAKSE